MNRTTITIVLILVLLTGAGLWWFGFGGNTTHGGTDIDNAAFVERGKTLYAQECTACHGKNREGQTPAWRRPLANGSFPAPPHDATGHTWHHADSLLFEITKYGRLQASPKRSQSNMPAFGEKFSDEDIWAGLTYIKSQWPATIRERHKAVNRQHRGAR